MSHASFLRMRREGARVSRLLAPLFVTTVLASPLEAQPDLSRFAAMSARSIGPAGMSGRVADIDVLETDPRVIWVGSATGGVWKSTNGGLVFEPVFDDEATSSIGAVAIAQRNPDIVWVGTGEANPRNSMGVGRGVWRTVDGGRSWRFLGLAASERISRIVLHPDDPNIAWVAALGPAWSDGTERGVFRTTDGGATWERQLFVDERTGAADLVMDPSNPNTMLAAMWSYRRWPWFFESGGPGSGLFITHDGGVNWRRLGPEDGLPAGELGRIGIAFARSAPRVVYALVEAERNALLRSDDGGHRWRTVNAEDGVNPRPFYYADIEVDPVNENRIYRIAGSLDVSDDGGRTFRTVVPSSKIHGDVHAVWLDPRDGQLLMQGNDGGIGISPDRGQTWRFVANLPLAQYYHISVDMDVPFNIYGGLQDNGSWVGPAHVRHGGGIRNYDFQRTGGGDGFASVVDPKAPRFLYGQSQQGSLYRFDRVTGERTSVQPAHPDGTKLRFNWNAGLAVDPHETGTLYFGSQFLHRSTDHGASWELISGDLTTNDPEKQRQAESGGLTLDATGAENHTTILTVAPSPVERGVIWVGTDDGNVQVTRDGGRSWTNVADRILAVRRPARPTGRAGQNRPLPVGTSVPHIEASRFVAGETYVVFEDHQRGNWTPYLYHTADYGQTWRALGSDGLDGFVHVIEQDPVERDLLFAGTEFGLFISFDGGSVWQKWTHGVPTVPVRDLVVHPRDHDLVIGTHGRALFVIDDVRPLRAIAAEPTILASRLHAFEPAPATQHEVAEPLGYRSTGDAMFFGENRPYGALLGFWAGAQTAAAQDGGAAATELEATLEIRDTNGGVLRTIRSEVSPGFNRVVWDLETTGFRQPGQRRAPDGGGPQVVPGTYDVRIRVGDAEATTRVTVELDARSTLTVADRRAQFDETRRLGARIEQAAQAVDRLRDVRDAIGLVRERARGESAAALRAAADSLETRLDRLQTLFTGPRGRQGIVDTDDAVVSRMRDAYGQVARGMGAPTPNHRLRARHAEAAFDAAITRLNTFLANDVARFRERVRAAGIELLPDIGAIRVGLDR